MKWYNKQSDNNKLFKFKFSDIYTHNNHDLIFLIDTQQ